MAYAGYSPRVSEIILQQGQQQAAAALQHGQTIGNLIASLGQSAAALPKEIDDAQSADKAKKQVELAHTLVQQHQKPDGTVDGPAVIASLRQAGAHDAADAFQKQWDAHEKDALAQKNTQSEIVARTAATTTAQNGDARATAKALQEQQDHDKAQARVEGVKAILAKHADPTTQKITDWGAAIDEVRQVDPEAAAHLTTSWEGAQRAERESADQARRDAATKLSLFSTPDDYKARRAALPANVQAFFPEEPPKTRREILQIGQTPNEQINSTIAQQRADKPPAPAGGASSGSDAKSIADAIINGDQPPELTGLYRMAGPVRAELAKQGYNMTNALTDWRATQKHVATLNGAKVTQMRSAITTASDSLDIIDDLAGKWKAGRFPMLNKANLALAKGGAYGKDAASIANQLEGQITDVVSELGQVYMGGNSPTDHALKLAEKNLSASWDEKVLRDMTKLARTNLQIRNNSMLHSGVAGTGTDNIYDQTPKVDKAVVPDFVWDPASKSLKPNPAKKGGGG